MGKYGSIAIIERFIRSVKQEHTRRILVPFRMAEFRASLCSYVEWYNQRQPHRSLGGQTPDEIYMGEKHYSPEFLAQDGKLAELDVVVSCHRGQSHLPVVELRKAA